jgi:hypothetical protein
MSQFTTSIGDELICTAQSLLPNISGNGDDMCFMCSNVMHSYSYATATDVDTVIKGVAKVSIEKLSQYSVLLSKSSLKNSKAKQIYFARI